MKVTDRWDGAGVPFQGDRTLRLLAIPAGARIVAARARVRPVSADPAAPFVERLSLEPGAAPGASAAAAVQGSALEVDLRGRRVLHALEGTGLDGAGLAVDPGGGLFVPVTADGMLGGPADGALQLSARDGAAALPGIAATRLRLMRGEGEAPRVTAVLVRSAPAALTLRVGGLPPFWAHPGDLTDEAVTPDFALLLAAWLAEQGTAEHGYTAVPLVVHTGSLSRLEVTVEVEVLLEAPLLPGGMMEATLPFDLSSLAVAPRGTSADFVARLPRGAAAVPGQTRIRVRGAFDETRAVPGRGPTGVIDPEAAKGRALVSAAFSQAQEVPPGAGAVIVGVDLLLRPLSRAVLLQVDLRGDAGGRPDRESLLPQAARVAVREGAEPGGAVWAGAAFAAPLTVDPCRRYWLVLQAVEGEAEWVAYRTDSEPARRLDLSGGRTCAPAPPAPGLQHSDDGGASWRAGGALLALYRLRSLPARYEVPLELEVGAGVDAGRIGLDRFAPLARVDFTVDDAALADAVTRHARGEADGCAPGEALRDGGFQAWTVEGDGMQDPLRVRGMGDAVPLRVVASPDGRWAYVLAVGGNAPRLLRVDVPGDAVVDEVPLEPAGSLAILPASTGFALSEEASALVVQPDGARAFVVASSRTDGETLEVRVQGVDLEHGRAAGPVRILPRDALPLAAAGGGLFPRLRAALSADGGTLWVASGDTVVGVDADALADGGAGPPIILATHGFAPEGVACLAPAPDGTRLYVGTVAGREGDGGRLHVVDLPGGGEDGEAVVLPGTPRDVAVTPDGTQAVVAHAAGAALVDLRRLAVLPVSPKPRTGTVSVVVEPDGRRAWVGGAGGLAALDLERRVLLAPFAVGLRGDPAVLAVTPQGDRLYAAGGADLRAVPLGARRLAWWTAESGRMEVGPPAADGVRGVVLRGADGGKADPAVIVQSLAVSAACRYVFSFRALAARGSGASAELLWVGAEGEPLDAWPLPIQEGDFPDGNGEPPPLRLHRRVVVPPAGAVRVEVRFRVPVGVGRVAAASLAVSADRLVNGDLRLPLRGEDGGWTVGPEARAAVVRALPGGGVRFSGVGPCPADVGQEVEVEPGVPLLLRVDGRGWAAPDGAVPSLRVEWTGDAGAPAGPPAALAIHPDDFTRHAMRLEPPDGAVRVRVALVLPPRAAVQVDRMTLLPAPEVDVPVRFVARAPGELTVTEARVVYEPGGSHAALVEAGTDAAGSPADTGCGAEDSAPPSGGAAPGAGSGGGGGAADDGCCGDDADAARSPAVGERPRRVPVSAPRTTAATRWTVPAASPPRLIGPILGMEPPLVLKQTPIEKPIPAEEPARVDETIEKEEPPRTDEPAEKEGPTRGGATTRIFEPFPGREVLESTIIRVPPDDAALADAGGTVAPDVPLAGTTGVREVPNVGDIREARFVGAGFHTAEALAAATPEQLLQADPTLSVKVANTLITRAAELVAAKNG
jgi:DNA-binding beta-propeller fold protein YncE